jgi:hypothetical protein
VPPVADQVIAGLVTPGIVAVNCWVALPTSAAVMGESKMLVTVIEALAVIAELATVAAVIVCVPSVVGAM